MSGKQATDHLLLRNLRDEADKRRFASFNAACNNAFEGATCDCLLHHQPETTQEDYWLIEDLTTGEVVSTVCLIPWQADFCGIEIKVAQLEMVLTHRDYRGRGLVRRLIQNFTQAVKQRGYDLSLIWGIPYYYRQFGFAYSVDGNMLEGLPIWRIPSASGDSEFNCQLRPASVADIPRLESLYDQVMQPLDFWLKRSPAHWAYLLGAAQPVDQLQGMVGLGTAQAYGRLRAEASAAGNFHAGQSLQQARQVDRCRGLDVAAGEDSHRLQRIGQLPRRACWGDDDFIPDEHGQFFGRDGQGQGKRCGQCGDAQGHGAIRSGSSPGSPLAC